MSVTTAYRRIADGSWPHERHGRLIRIPAAFVTSRQKPPGVATRLAGERDAADTGGTDKEQAA
ncbi:MAG: hypothetical protein EA387_04140 [Nitriliruptor sp.]|nr:MAG: hypothetical protein EA387_04140 [Nitriliruptor sp.]